MSTPGVEFGLRPKSEIADEVRGYAATVKDLYELAALDARFKERGLSILPDAAREALDGWVEQGRDAKQWVEDLKVESKIHGEDSVVIEDLLACVGGHAISGINSLQAALE